ncbi:Hydrogen peroxide-inducible activator [Minicystis rosea]|nr:Hydrogen peroxide-inducible activator [Minicystis rosea]
MDGSSPRVGCMKPTANDSPQAPNLSALTLTQLRYLAALDQHRSFRVAAERCHVTQPALSMQIQKLEELFGFPVFDRSAQPIVPTEQGEAVLAQARAVLRECDRLGDVVRVACGQKLSGLYRLGVIPTLAPTLVPLLLPAFVRDHPTVELVVEELRTEPLIARVLDGSLDGGLAATPLSVPGLHERPLFVEALAVYLAPDHPLTQRTHVLQSDLVEHRPWLLEEGHCFRNQVLHVCRLARRYDGPQARFDGSSFETLVSLVDAGIGLTVLPRSVVARLSEAQRRRVRSFAEPAPAREVSFVFSREQLRRRIADAVVEELVRAVPAALGDGGFRLAHDVTEDTGFAVLPPTAPTSE